MRNQFQRVAGRNLICPAPGVLAGVSAITVFLIFTAVGLADDWPPKLDASNTTTQSLDGRIIERYTHGRREAWGYPVFTHASSDQRSPWLNAPADFDDSGQINAYFRWKDQHDTPSSFALQLWIAHPSVKNPPPAMPDNGTVDITLRRLQEFKIQPGHSYTWQMSRKGHLVASGMISPDSANLLTIPQGTLTTISTELSVKPATVEKK